MSLPADAIDNTMWPMGVVVKNKLFFDPEHASGEFGEGVLNILKAGNQLAGDWKSAGSSSDFGV